MLFFVRRRWAVRVITETGLPIKGPTATLLIDLIIWASKRSAETAYAATGLRMPRADAVLMTAMGLHRNPTAIHRLMRDLPLDESQAQAALAATHDAARAVAIRHGFDRLVSSDSR